MSDTIHKSPLLWVVAAREAHAHIGFVSGTMVDLRFQMVQKIQRPLSVWVERGKVKLRVSKASSERAGRSQEAVTQRLKLRQAADRRGSPA